MSLALFLILWNVFILLQATVVTITAIPYGAFSVKRLAAAFEHQ